MNDEINILRKYVPNIDSIKHIIGIDEVGWGAVCGPLVVVATVVPVKFKNPGLKDSKRYTTDKSRRKGAELAKEHVTKWLIKSSTPAEIVEYGPGFALSYLQRNAAKELLSEFSDAIIVVDGNKKILGVKEKFQVSIVAADAKICAVSAASIIAKVERDNYMIELGTEYPEWELEHNKGYPTEQHLKLLEKFGPTKHHRMNIKQINKSFEKFGYYENRVP